jgi:coenzyme F420-0:L-glutamate ligase/coenzyme F420-1:gamma-L-glutamate ligase
LAIDNASRLVLLALPGIPLINKGDDLPAIVWNAIADAGERLQDGDVLILAQKIISKAEGRTVALADVQPSARAIELASIAQKDPRIVELILAESVEVLRCRTGVIIVEHRSGFVLANAGIDASNVGGGDSVLLLPLDADQSAAHIRDELSRLSGRELAVIINDSIGRAWRNGTVGTALGAAGIPGLLDLRGSPDLFGRALRVTEIGFADELAAAASLMMGQAGEGRPVVLARGVPYARRNGKAAELIRSKELDLFR